MTRALAQPSAGPSRTIASGGWADDRGALLVSGLFMMIVAVAMMYFFIGTANTLKAREGMQDAADASAFAAAVLMARGMNLIALINLLMATLVAILVAIRLVQTFMQVSAILLYGGAWYFGTTVPAATACQTAATQLNQAYENAKDPIFQMVEALHDVQEATSVVIPFLALGAGMLEAVQHHPPADGAFALPAPESLPVESDEFPVLCAHATDLAVTGSISTFTGFLPDPAQSFAEKLMTPVSKAAEAIGAATSAYLCGEGGSQPPKYSFQTDVELPQPEETEACDEQEEWESELCAAVKADWEATKPRSPDGQCTQNCGFDGPYETRARQARYDCEPGVNGYAKEYTWQSAWVDTTWIFENGQWREESQALSDLELQTTKDPPCGFMGSIRTDEWHRNSGDRGHEHPDFLCSLGSSPRPAVGTDGQRWTSPPYRAALRVFSCVFEKEERVDIAEEEDRFSGEQDEEKSPHRMQDVELGSETFQVRSIAFGPEVGPGKSIDGVRLALMGKESGELGDALFEFGTIFNRFSIAQAEYFYDGQPDTPREDWLWEMRWRARLVRVRLPTEEEQQEEEERQQESSDAVATNVQKYVGAEMGDSLEEVCKAVTSECPSESELEELTDLVIH